MLTLRARLRPGFLFVSLLAALWLAGCPTPAPAKPKRPVPTPPSFQVLLYARKEMLRGQPAQDWRARGVTHLILGTQVIYHVRLTPERVRSGLDDAVAVTNGAPWYLSLSSTAHMENGDDMTFGGLTDEARWSTVTLPNLREIAAYCRDKGCAGYLLDTELYGRRMPEQVPGLAWPDAPKGVPEKRAQQWVEAIQTGHPGAFIGMHGFHSWEKRFPSYKRWSAALGGELKRRKLRGAMLDEDWYTNQFEKAAEGEGLNGLQEFYGGMDVWPMFYAQSGGTPETVEVTYNRLVSVTPKLAKKCGGIAWYQNDDLWSRTPALGQVFTKAMRALRADH